jgi:hypothetical protein
MMFLFVLKFNDFVLMEFKTGSEMLESFYSWWGTLHVLSLSNGKGKMS